MNRAPENSKSESSEHYCQNCNSPKPATDSFCRTCGQKHTDLNDGVFHFICEFITELFSLDGRVFRTLAMLYAKPGELTNEFMRGRRKRYLSPVQIYLFSTFLFFFTFGSWAQPNASQLAKIELDSSSTQPAGTVPSTSPEIPSGKPNSKSDPSTATVAPAEKNQQTKAVSNSPKEQKSEHWINVRLPNGNTRFTEEEFRRFANMSDEEVAQSLSDHDMEPYPWLVTLLRNASKLTTEIGAQRYYATMVAIASQVALVMLPFLAILLRTLFWRSSQSLLQSFVLASHAHVSISLLLSPFMLLGVSGAMILGIGGLIGGTHLALTLRNVFHESWFWTVLKMSVMTSLYAITLLIGFGIIGTVALFMY